MLIAVDFSYALLHRMVNFNMDKVNRHYPVWSSEKLLSHIHSRYWHHIQFISSRNRQLTVSIESCPSCRNNVLLRMTQRNVYMPCPFYNDMKLLRGEPRCITVTLVDVSEISSWRMVLLKLTANSNMR